MPLAFNPESYLAPQCHPLKLTCWQSPLPPAVGENDPSVTAVLLQGNSLHCSPYN